jgi:hypothetical protein
MNTNKTNKQNLWQTRSPFVKKMSNSWLKNGALKMMSPIHDSRGSAPLTPQKNNSVIHHSVEPPSRSQRRSQSPHYSKKQPRFSVFPKNVRFFKQMSVFLNSSPLFARARMLNLSPVGSYRRFQQNQTQAQSI